MAGYCDPPNRFSSTNQPTGRGRPKGSISIVTELKRLLKKKIKYEDPETKLMVNGKILRVIALRLILNACQGENEAIKEILDRIDGKTVQKLLGEGFGGDTTVNVYPSKILIFKDIKENAGIGRTDNLSVEESAGSARQEVAL